MSLKRNKLAKNNCPHCGVFVFPNYQNRIDDHPPSLPQEILNHRCDPKFLQHSEASQNAAMLRDPDNAEPRARTEGQRLAEGYEMLDDDDL